MISTHPMDSFQILPGPSPGANENRNPCLQLNSAAGNDYFLSAIQMPRKMLIQGLTARTEIISNMATGRTGIETERGLR